MDDADVQVTSALDGGTWYGFHIVTGTIVAIVSIAYIARYFKADGKIKNRDAFRQNDSTKEAATEKQSIEGNRSKDVNGSIIDTTENSINKKNLRQDEALVKVGDNSFKDENDVTNNEYRNIVNDEEYIDICPQSNNGSKVKKKIAVNSVKTDELLRLHLIEEEIAEHNPFKETSSNSNESVQFEHKESICNRRSLAAHENEIDITSMKCGSPVEHSHVYRPNGLEKTNIQSVDDDKSDSHLANEFSLTSDADEIQRSEQESSNNIETCSGLGNQTHSSRRIIPIVIISENTEADNDYVKEENVHWNDHLSNKHIVTNTELDVDQLTDKDIQSLVSSTICSDATPSTMSTPEDIACFYQDEFEEENGTARHSDIRHKNDVLGDLMETSFVAVIPTSICNDWGTERISSRNDEFTENIIKPYKVNNTDNYDDGIVITHMNKKAHENIDDDQQKEIIENAEDEEEEADGDDIEEDEDSDESGGLETIEEVSEEEESEEIFEDHDTLENQLYTKATRDDIERTYKTAEHVDTPEEQIEEAHNERQHIKNQSAEHRNVDEHDHVECYSSSTDEMHDLDFMNSSKNPDIFDVINHGTKSFVETPNLGIRKGTETDNDVLGKCKQNVLPNQISSMDEYSKHIQSKHLFGIKQISVDRDLNYSHGNGEVTPVELIDHPIDSLALDDVRSKDCNVEEKTAFTHNLLNNVIISDKVEHSSAEYKRIDQPINDKSQQNYVSSKSEHLPLRSDIPVIGIKELDKIRPLPFTTREENSIDASLLSNPSFDNIDSACVDIQQKPLHGQIEHNEVEVHVDSQIQRNEDEVPIDTTTVESQLDFEAPLLSTIGLPIRREDNCYSDDVCKHGLTLSSQSEDQASADQISQQTGKQSVTIELHLLRRKPNSITEGEIPLTAKEEFVCQPPKEHLENLQESERKAYDDKSDTQIVTRDGIPGKGVDIPCENAVTLGNGDSNSNQRTVGNRRLSNDDISSSLESVTSKNGSNRKLSVHEQRVLDSLKNLQLPDWYKKSDIHKRKMKNMAEGRVLRSDSETEFGQNRFYNRQKSFGSDDSDFSTKQPRPISTRMSYERKAKYYYSAQHLPTRLQTDEYQNSKFASASYLKTQSNYDIRSLDKNKPISEFNSGYSDDLCGKEFTEDSKITERPQSESDLVNMEPIPMNNFKIQRKRSNKGTATFYITSVHVQNKNTKQNQSNCANGIRGSDSSINACANTARDNNNVIELAKETNNGVHNNRNDSYPEEVTYKHNPYTYKLVYGTPQSISEKTTAVDVERQETSDGNEFYKESDHVEYYASIVQCGDVMVNDRSSNINQTNLSPDIDSAINSDNTMSSGLDSESLHEYGRESCHSGGSVYVPSVTHSAPPFVEHKQKTKPSNFQQNTIKNCEPRKISSSFDDVIKQKTDNRSGKGRTPSANSSLDSKTSPRFPVINRSRDNVLANGKKNGISISITDTRLDDSPSHRIDEEEFEKHLENPIQQSNSEDKGKAVVMENIIDGLLGLTSPSVNNSSTFSYNETASSSNLMSSESDSSAGVFKPKLNESAKKQNSSSDDTNHVVHCRKCKVSVNLAEARKTFKNCHHCYTYYCSRDCRIEHWEEHKQRCIFARVSSSCKHAVAVCRDDGSTHYTLSKIARTCYLSHGRGSILIVFPNEIAARLFVHYGLRAVPSPPSYITARELEKTQEPNEHTTSLLSVCQAYDPNKSFILTVIVNIGIEIPKKPVPRRQGTAIKKCANFSLCETHITQPNTRANETTGETLILTMPPGLPPDGTRDRKLRQVCFVNIQRHLRQREVKLRHQFPAIYSALCRWVEYHESFPPTTIYPKEGAADRPFMCLIMPESDPDALGWVNNPGLLEDIEMDEFE